MFYLTTLLYLFLALFSHQSFGSQKDIALVNPTIIKIHGSVGNKRDIYGINVLVPFLSYQDGVTFINIIGSEDSKNNQELNLGIGKKYDFGHYHFGAYTFYDYRNTNLNHDVHQLTFGAELILHTIEARTNFYLPISNEKILDSSNVFTREAPNSKTRIITQNIIHKISQPLSGLDFEIGCNNLFKKRLSIYGGILHFYAKTTSNMTGISTRIIYKLNSYFAIYSNHSWDNVRGYLNNTGISFTLQNLKNKNRSYKRIFTAPVRDIDIVVLPSEKTTKTIRYSFSSA